MVETAAAPKPTINKLFAIDASKVDEKIRGAYVNLKADLKTLAIMSHDLFDGKTQALGSGKDKVDIKPSKDFVIVESSSVINLTDRLEMGSGDTEKVTLLQEHLAMHNFPVEADGDFGPATEDAVRKFQLASDIDTDGVVGEKTWKALGKVKVHQDALKQYLSKNFPYDKDNPKDTPTNKLLDDEVSAKSGTIAKTEETNGDGKNTSNSNGDVKGTGSTTDNGKVKIPGAHELKSGETIKAPKKQYKYVHLVGIPSKQFVKDHKNDLTLTRVPNTNDLKITFKNGASTLEYTFQEVFDSSDKQTDTSIYIKRQDENQPMLIFDDTTPENIKESMQTLDNFTLNKIP